MNEIIEFTVKSKTHDNVTVEGYVYADEIDNESPLTFYKGRTYDETSYVPENKFNEDSQEWEAYEKITSAFQSDDLFLQYLHDCKNENKTIDRGEYVLIINKGEEI